MSQASILRRALLVQRERASTSLNQFVGVQPAIRLQATSSTEHRSFSTPPSLDSLKYAKIPGFQTPATQLDDMLRSSLWLIPRQGTGVYNVFCIMSAMKERMNEGLAKVFQNAY